jgi:ribosomal protein S6
LKAYDALFIFDEKLDGEALDAVLARIGDEIVRLGGAVERTENAGRHVFARPMRRRTHGLYVWVTLRIPPDNVAALRARLKLVEEIVRVQIEYARPFPDPETAEAAAGIAAESEKGEYDGQS